jgi:hypothetical protein
MDYPKEYSKSVYHYSDKSVQHAGYAAVAYAGISILSGVFAWIQYFLYHRPGKASVLPDDFAAQQYLQHTPLITAVALAFSVILAAISGVLAFFIFRRRRFAVVAFLLRGARRMFQDYAEHQLDAPKEI